MDINWECFAYVNAANKPAAFEDICRLLFKQQFISDTQVVHINPNNAGIECEPINPTTETNSGQTDTHTIIELSRKIAVLSTQVEELQPVADENKKLINALYADCVAISFNIMHDFLNMTHFYHKLKKWGGLVYITERWYEKHKSTQSLINCALAFKHFSLIQLAFSINTTCSLLDTFVDKRVKI